MDAGRRELGDLLRLPVELDDRPASTVGDGFHRAVGSRGAAHHPLVEYVEAGVTAGDELLDTAQEYLAPLQSAGVDVHLVTAGIAQAIAPLAARLNIAPRAVHAVPLQFDADGNYVDFDRRSLLTRPGGKELVVRAILTRAKGKSAFVGDGITDLDAKPAVDLFIGFGGVVTRDRVREQAAVYVTEPTLAAVLPYLT